MLVCIITGYEITTEVPENLLKVIAEEEIWYEVVGNEIYLYEEDFKDHLLLIIHMVYSIDVKLC